MGNYRDDGEVKLSPMGDLEQRGAHERRQKNKEKKHKKSRGPGGGQLESARTADQMGEVGRKSTELAKVNRWRECGNESEETGEDLQRGNRKRKDERYREDERGPERDGEVVVLKMTILCPTKKPKNEGRRISV